MALSLAARRLAPQAQGVAARLLGSSSVGGDKILDIDALRAQRAALVETKAESEAPPERVLEVAALRAQRARVAQLTASRAARVAESAAQRAAKAPRAAAPRAPRLVSPTAVRARPDRIGFTQAEFKLSETLEACTSWSAVLETASGSAALNAVNALAALHFASRLAGKGDEAAQLRADPRFEQLLVTLDTRLPEMDSWAVVSLWRALAKLGVSLPDDRRQRLLDALSHKLAVFSRSQLTRVLSACTELGVPPPASFLQRYFELTSSPAPIEPTKNALPSSSAAVKAPAQTAPSSGDKPPRRTPAPKPAPKPAPTPALTPAEQQALSEAIAACTTAESLLDLVAPTVAALNDTTFTAALSKLAGERDAASLKADARVERLVADAHRRMGKASLSARCRATVLYSLAKLGAELPALAMQRYFADRNVKSMFVLDPPELVTSLLACVMQQAVPPAPWMQRHFEASGTKLSEFTPAELANLLMACGHLSATPPDAWQQLLWDASAAQMGAFTPPDFAQLLCACSRLGLVPPAEWQQHCLRTLAPKLDDTSAQHLATVIHACGHLGIAPPTEWLLTFSRRCKAVLGDMNRQGIASTVLGLAYLGAWDLPLWPALWEVAWSLLPRDPVGWKYEDREYAKMLYQVYHAAAAERSGKLRTPGSEQLDAAKAKWAANEQNRPAQAEGTADVAACLSGMGVAHSQLHWCDRAERVMQLAVGGTVSLEVNTRAVMLSDGQLRGPRRLRSRVLQAHGWRVADLDVVAWLQLETPAQREEHLRTLLAL